MVFKKDDLSEWLEEIGSKIEKPITIYLVGGGCMSFKGLKTATKDIDLVITSQEDFQVLNEALQNLGYQLATDLAEEFYLTATAVYLRGDSRIDLFVGDVAGKLEFNGRIQERSLLVQSLGKLSLCLASNEDMFLFKSVTGRKDDLEDCRILFLNGLNWDTIFEECLEQSKKRAQWFFWLYERICELEEDYNLISPVKNKLLKVCKEYWKDRPTDFLDCVQEKAKFT